MWGDEKMLRREFVLMSGALAIAGCSAEKPIQAVTPSQLRVTRVDVTLARPDIIEKSLSRWNIGVSKEKFVADVRSALELEMIPVSRKGSRPVRLEVVIMEVNLNSAIPDIIKPVFVSLSSQMTGRLTIADAKTGEVLIRRGVLGDDIPGDISFRSVARESMKPIKSVPRAYRDIVRGFAEDATRQLFNTEPTKAPPRAGSRSDGTKCRNQKVFNAVRGLYEEKIICE